MAETSSHDANPGNKRPRTAAESCLLGSSGKGITKHASSWAAPQLAAVHSELARKAKALGKTIQNRSSSIQKLQQLQAAGTIPPTLTLKRSPAAQALLDAAPALKERLQVLERDLLAAALQERQQEGTTATEELNAILTGDAFQRASKEALSFDTQPSTYQLQLDPLITAAEVEFKSAMHFGQLDVQRRTAKAEKAAAARATATERRKMEMDQMETDRSVLQVVREEMATHLPKLLKKQQQQRGVQFASRGRAQGRSQTPQRSQSRGRSAARGQQRATPRAQTPARSASRTPRNAPHMPRSAPSTPRGRNQPRSGHRPRQPPRADSLRTPRSKSRPRSFPPKNTGGGRGARPHRSPSAWPAGGGRSGGASGSKMGARR